MFTDLVYVDVLQLAFWKNKNNLQFCKNYGPGYLSWYSDSLWDGRSGDRIPVGTRLSAPVQIGSEAHPASYTMGTGAFPEVKRPGRGADYASHLASRLSKEYSYTSTPLLGLRGLL